MDGTHYIYLYNINHCVKRNVHMQGCCLPLSVIHVPLCDAKSQTG